MAIDPGEIKTRLAQLGQADDQLAAWLDGLPLVDGQRALTNLRLLKDRLNDPELLTQILADSLESADPDAALNLLERIADQQWGGELETVLQQVPERHYLLTILGGSPFLAGILCREPSYLHDLLIDGQLHQTLAEAQMLGELRRTIADEVDFAQLQAGLRRYKAAQILRIGGRDLCGLADLEQVMEELTALAAACLQRACEVCSLHLQEDYGRPLQQDENGQQSPAEMTILGMGKLGAHELNFSSDIDLIFCYSSNQGATEGGRRDSSISLHRYFVKLAEQITRALHQVTADGFVFRVDTRLRPDGNNGNLAISLDAAEAYYQSWGQSWERAALLKARPVAGSIPLGMELLQRLKPFVFRRHLDFGMIEDIKGMKQKINASLERKQEGDRNLKLGYGGIREIEFFIQALQLINAGRRPHLQHRNSLKVLTLLEDEELISAVDLQLLRGAYRFLRQVEHRIQVVQEQQTHVLPREARALTTLARRCGFADREAFLGCLQEHRRAVAQIFNDLFHSDEEISPVRPEITFIFNPEADPDLVKDLLEEKGFTNPDTAYASLQMLRGGDPHKRLTRRGTRNLEKLSSLLLEEILDSPDPDQALNNLEGFLGSIHARSSYFSLLVENPAIVKLLIELFASSQMLSRIFIQRPELLDTLVSRSYAVAYKDRQQMSAELIDQMTQAEDYEQKLDCLRRFRNEELLRVALQDLHGQMRQGICAQQLSWLAEACLEEAWRLAHQELAVRFGGPESADDQESGHRELGFAIVGMGKLGGCELNYHSDLDIIFIYQAEGHTQATPETDPGRFRQISHQEYFAKLAQRIISILTLVTREGYVYKIDTRLRPSGNQGPLVTSLEAFRHYHRESAQPWERQAMTKARVVCGPARFAEEVQESIISLTYERPLPADLRAEMYRLRERMEKEIARENDSLFNIKTGRGGMVDVEFIVQYLQLIHGRDYPSLRDQNTLSLLESMRKEDILKSQQVDSLIKGYRFLRRLENKLRLFYDQSINELPSTGNKLRKIALSLRYGGSGQQPELDFRDQYRLVTEEIRSLLEAFLNPPDAPKAEG